jgi:hypothetical protein
VRSSDLILILVEAATEGRREGHNCKCRIKQEFEKLGMGDIWENGRNNNKKI